MQQSASSSLDFEEYLEKVNPVFIFGSPRSGTTLTYHIMNFHPQVVKLPADTYFFKHFWNIRHHVPTKALHKILIISSGLYSPRSASPQGEPEADRLLSRALLNLVKEDDPQKIFSFISYIGYRRQADHAYDSVRWWAERSNHHAFYYQNLKTWFPQCKFIFCVRDPRAVITSELGALEAKGRELSSVSNYCLISAIDWMRRNKLALEMQEKFADDIFISRYEDLVTAPVNHINRIWRFLDIPELEESELRERIEGLGPIYKSKTGVERSGGIDSRSVERWKHILAPTDAAIIEDVTGKTALRFGYEYRDSKVPITFYIKKLPTEDWNTYSKRLVKVLFLKSAPERLFQLIEIVSRVRAGIASVRDALGFS